MFSLIIAIISIALVAALAIATIYYGGVSFSKGGIRAAADAILNQAVQIAAAGQVASSQGPGWPTGANPSFSQPYLAAMPVPPKAAYADGASVPSASDWTYYLGTGSTSHHFVIQDKIAKEVCLPVNKMQGFVGIPAAWDGKTLIQCFGPGVTTSTGAKAYTFFYDPPGTTLTQKQAASDKSVADANIVLSATPAETVGADTASPGATTPVASATPGYPRACPSGNVINSGSCADSDSGGSGGGGPGPTASFNLPWNEVISSDGSGDISLCTTDLPPNSFTMDSTLTVEGAVLPAYDVWEASPGQQCIGVVGGFPPHAEGNVSATINNADGSKATGNVQYLSPPSNTTGTLIYPSAGSSTAFEDGTGVVQMCVDGVIPNSFTMSSIVSVAGGTATVLDSYQVSMTRQCLVVQDFPPHAAGAVPVSVANDNSTTATGNLAYVKPGPTISGNASQYYLFNDESRVTMITGDGFTSSSVVYGWKDKPLATSFIDAQHVKVTIPVASSIGVDVSSAHVAVRLYAKNPDTGFSQAYAEVMYRLTPIRKSTLSMDIDWTPTDGFSKAGSQGIDPSAGDWITACPTEAADATLFADASSAYVRLDNQEVDQWLGWSTSRPGVTCVFFKVPPSTKTGTVTLKVMAYTSVAESKDTEFTIPFVYKP